MKERYNLIKCHGITLLLVYILILNFPKGCTENSNTHTSNSLITHCHYIMLTYTLRTFLFWENVANYCTKIFMFRMKSGAKNRKNNERVTLALCQNVRHFQSIPAVIGSIEAFLPIALFLRPTHEVYIDIYLERHKRMDLSVWHEISSFTSYLRYCILKKNKTTIFTDIFDTITFISLKNK